ncbi:MAG: NAD(P)-dependent oxidoreductase [Shimia sp.]
MDILLFGASGRTGRPLAEQLIAAGHKVTSLGRSDPGIPGLTHHKGDVTRPADIAPHLPAQGAVMAALASSKDNALCSRTARAVIEAAKGQSVRYVTVAGAAVDAPGDAKGVPDKIIGGIMKIVAGGMLADRQAEHDLLLRSTLRWTMVRPPRLTNDAATGRWVFSFDKPSSTKIARADLAGAMIEALGRADFEGKAPFVAAA